MTSRLGRADRSLDENVRLHRPLDDTSDVSATGIGRKGIGRAPVLVGVIVCGLVGPAAARAADPFGTASLGQQVDTAVATAAGAVSPQAAAVSPPALEPASVAPVNEAATKTAEMAATKTVELATKQAAAVASTATADAQREIQRTAPASPSASSQAPSTERAHRRAARHRTRRARRSASSLHVPPTVPTSTENRVALVPTKVVDQRFAQTRREGRGGPGARATPETRAGPTPQRHPPSPWPPGPGGAAVSGQSGVHGPLSPLLVGALAAALLALAFEFLPRALPLRAFRKPGHLPLPPWHPG
jgi:hypothetical protein